MMASDELINSPLLENIYDVIERLRVAKRSAEHLLCLVNFLSEFYNQYYQYYKEGKKEREGSSNDENIYSGYRPILELILRDINELLKLVADIRKCAIEGKYDITNLKKELFRNIIFKGFEKAEEERDILVEYADSLALTEKLGGLLDVLQTIRSSPDGTVPGHEISLGSITRALNNLSHSIEQSLGGMFVGSVIEHQPSVYPHKDIYHAMRYSQVFCEGYSLSLINLFSKVFEKETERKHFYRLTGINLDIQNNDHTNYLKYRIVFGDSALPELLDRYKLIALPMVCVYRNRYWPALAHEVAHSYSSGLIHYMRIEEWMKKYRYWEIMESSDTDSDKERSARKILTELIDYCTDILSTDPFLSKVLKSQKSPSMRRRNIQFVISEIMADIFAFLLSGYAYLPILLSNISWDFAYEVEAGHLPYLIRISMIFKIADIFTRDFKVELQNIPTRLMNELNIDKKNIIGNVCNNFLDCMENVENFLNKFKSYLRLSIPEEKRKATYYNYFLSFGSDLGSVVYQRFLKELLENYILSLSHEKAKKIPFFGWIWNKSENKGNNKEIIGLKNAIFNLLINSEIIKRFNVDKKIESSSVKSVDQYLCYNVETAKLYIYMKMIEWEVKYVRKYNTRGA